MLARKIFFLLLAIWVIHHLLKNRIEKFFYTSQIEFMSKEKTADFFREDKDSYLQNMTKYDVMAMKSSSKQEYLENSCLDAEDFTEEDKQKLERVCNEVDHYILNKMEKIPFIDNEKLGKMKWVLAKTGGKYYEDGYPHTRLNVIFITPEVIKRNDCGRTMLHEKVHVYERIFPRDMERWIKHMGYKPYKRFSDYKYGRGNPDLDGWVYIDPLGNETLAIFNTETPKGIDDSHYPGGMNYMAEHPNETLAYYIDHKYVKEPFPYPDLIKRIEKFD